MSTLDAGEYRGSIVVNEMEKSRMDQEKKITAPRQLWGRLRAMMVREGIGTISEAVRFSIHKACTESEGRDLSYVGDPIKARATQGETE